MVQVFIDTQIFLRLYPLKDEWSLLGRVQKLISNGEAQLIFPDFIFDEIVRNVYGIKETFLSGDAKKIDDMLQVNLSSGNIKKLGLKEKEIIKIKQDLEKLKKKKLLELKKERLKYAEEFLTEVKKFKSASSSYPITSELIKTARERQILGNPPSRINDPIGDNLAWELILQSCTDQDLLIVSDDGGWKRDNFSEELHPILHEEWKQKAGSNKIFLLTSIAALINKLNPKNPVSKEVAEKEKSSSIDLIGSSPFLQVPIGTATIFEPIGPLGPTGPISGNVGTSDQFMGGISGSVGTFTTVQSKCSSCHNLLSFRPSYCSYCGTYNGL